MNKSTSNDESVRLSQLKMYLDGAGIAYTILVHAQNISSAEDGAQTGLGALSAMAPTFILRTEVGYLAAIVRGDTRLSYCTLANFRHMHVNILLGPPGIKAQSTNGWRNGMCQPLNGARGRMKTSAQLVV